MTDHKEIRAGRFIFTMSPAEGRSEITVKPNGGNESACFRMQTAEAAKTFETSLETLRDAAEAATTLEPGQAVRYLCYRLFHLMKEATDNG